jgi:hypothetical protein
MAGFFHNGTLILHTEEQKSGNTGFHSVRDKNYQNL